MEPEERSKWIETLLRHAGRYSVMEPADAVKLAYQSVFGGGHLVSDEESCLTRLSAERANALETGGFAGQEAFEPIGFGRARMMLGSPALAALPDALLSRAFMLSSGEPAGDAALFSEALDVLTQTVFSGAFPFAPEAFFAYLGRYRASGCPMVSHSETYRLAYRPAYRVVGSAYVRALGALVSLGGRFPRKVAAQALSCLPEEPREFLLETIPVQIDGR